MHYQVSLPNKSGEIDIWGENVVGADESLLFMIGWSFFRVTGYVHQQNGQLTRIVGTERVTESQC